MLWSLCHSDHSDVRYTLKENQQLSQHVFDKLSKFWFILEGIEKVKKEFENHKRVEPFGKKEKYIMKMCYKKICKHLWDMLFQQATNQEKDNICL